MNATSRKRKKSGFILLATLPVLILTSATITAICDFALTTLQITNSLKKGHSDYVNKTFEMLIQLPSISPVKISTPKTWITSLSDYPLVPSWDKLLNKSSKCPIGDFPSSELAFLAHLSLGTCNEVTFSDDYSFSVIGNILSENLELKINAPQIDQAPMLIIASGIVKISNLKVNFPAVIVSASGIQIDNLSGNSSIHLLASEQINIGHNVIPDLTFEYKNFHINLDKIQSNVIGNVMVTNPPSLYGFWIDRDS